MFKRTFAALTILATIIYFAVEVEAAKLKQNPAEAIQFFAESYVFGTGENSAAENFLSTTLKEFPLNSATAEKIKVTYAAKLQSVMKITATLKKSDRERPIVTITTTPVNALATDTNELLALKVDSVMGANPAWQTRAFQTIDNFIEDLPFRKTSQSFDVVCIAKKNSDGNISWEPEDISAFQNFLAPNIFLPSKTEIENFLGGLGGEIETFTPPVKPPTKFDPVEQSNTDGDNWLIYWYVCGTDIETGTPNRLKTDRENPGNITTCIEEVEKADLSSGKVKILMQAGGTSNWTHEKFKPNNGNVGRYLFDRDNRDWKPAEKLVPINLNKPSSLMSYREGLEDFLSYGKKLEQKLYPDGKFRRVFIFVDHGGGSLRGVCKDEYTNGQMLGLKDMKKAFDEVFGNSTKNPPFELVAFDTCLMSTYETAVALKGTARFMTASQEEIFSKIMFEYTGFLSELSANPNMNGEALGRIICDTYYQNCISASEIEKKTEGLVNTNDYPAFATMSVIDLSKMPDLESAYENFGKATLKYLKENPDPGPFSNAKLSAEKYPIPKNAKNPPYRMIDLKDYADKIKKSPSRFKSDDLKGACDKLITAINKPVVYNEVRGDLRPDGGGLSTYYPFNLTKNDIDAYKELADEKFAPKSQSEFYSLMLDKFAANPSSLPTSKVPSSNTNSANNTNAENPSPPQGITFDLSDLKEVNVEVDHETNTAKIKLTQEQMNRVASVNCILVNFTYAWKDGDLKLNWRLLGNDTAIKANWDTGEFESTFTGEWITIENQPVCVHVISEAKVDEDGNKNGIELYSVPIELNDQACNLLISCKYPEEDFRLVATRPDTNSDVPTGELYGIKKGDEVTPIYYESTISAEKIYTLLEELIEKFTEKYPAVGEIIYSETLSDEEKTKAVETWRETLSDEEKQKIERDMDALWEKFISGGGLDFKRHKGNSFEISDTIRIDNDSLPDGVYIYAFEFVNPVGDENVYSSSFAVFVVKDKKICYTLPKEEMWKLINILFTSYREARKKIESANDLED